MTDTPAKSDWTYTQDRVWSLWLRARELEADVANHSEAEAEAYKILADHFADEFMMTLKGQGYIVDEDCMDGIDVDQVLADVYAAYYDVDGISYPEWPKDAPAQPSADAEDLAEQGRFGSRDR